MAHHTTLEMAAISIVPKVTAFISVFSMTYTSQLIIRSKRRLQRMENRMFLGLAIYDILRNLTFIVGTCAIPVNVEGYFMNVGNMASCKTQAFLSQLGVGVFIYLAALCITFYLAIRHDFNESRYARIEKYSHLTCNLIPLSLAISLLSTNYYGPESKDARNKLLNLMTNFQTNLLHFTHNSFPPHQQRDVGYLLRAQPAEILNLCENSQKDVTILALPQ
jgi:hypothetical protein